jgi:hypothetical protein
MHSSQREHAVRKTQLLRTLEVLATVSTQYAVESQ